MYRQDFQIVYLYTLSIFYKCYDTKVTSVKLSLLAGPLT